MSPSSRRRAAALSLASLLAACGSGGGTDPASASDPDDVAPPPAALPATPDMSPDAPPAAALPGREMPGRPVDPAPASAPVPDPVRDREIAMRLWRNGDLSRHPKGSCAGCHGADFFDLARVGSTDEDIVRRATEDGATRDEAEALRRAVREMRVDMGLPETDPRAFRPFQPGGAPLLSDATGSDRVVAVMRDVAFGRSIEARLPTLFGPRIGSLGAARRAADQLLDIAEGTDRAGANPDRVQLRDLPNGIPYPLWSADLHHGAHEGTLNDWIADVAHEAPPAEQDAWFAIQDTWLAAPTRENFWRMYVAAEDLVQTTQFEHCAFTGEYTFAESACFASRRFSRAKFLSALIGQHQLRVPFAGGAEDLMDGALAFANTDDDPALDFMKDRKEPRYLPASPWDIGDDARVMIHREKAPGTLREQLGTRGFPSFVVDSVDPARNTTDEEEDLRVAWFWQGFVMDPSFQRIGKGTSGSAEYMVESFNNTNRFVHLSFSAHMRLAAKGFLQEANVDHVDRRRELAKRPPTFTMNYSYFNGYGRPVLRWREDRKGGDVIPDALKREQETLFHRLTANGYRMSLHLWLDAIADGVDPRRENLDAIKAHFDRYQPEHAGADAELLNRVKLATGDAELYPVPD